MQAPETTNALAVLGRFQDEAQVDRDTLIALSSLADRRGRLVGFVELGLEANRAVIDLGADSVLVHV
jgi:hypothetical protein